MTIATLEDYATALKQVSVTTGKTVTCDGLMGAGFPAAGIAPSNSANGVVPTNATQGAIAIAPFGGSGYITKISLIEQTQFGDAVWLCDRLFECGTYVNGTGTTTLSAQPSFSSRIPGGTDYSGLWLVACAVNSSATPTGVTVTYTNEGGTTGHSTGAVTLALGGTGLGQGVRLPLQSGDSGLQKIESVSVTGGSATGAIYIVILRPLKMVWISGSGGGTAGDTFGAPVYGIGRVGMARIWSTSCLQFFAGLGTVAGIAADIEIASK